MATYNRAHYINEALKSIKNQTYKNWECIIIDDGSSDNTKDIIKEYIKENSRFKYHHRSSNHKKGLPGCRNQGIELANGEYIVYFDDDDIVHPQNLEINLYFFEDKVDYVRYGRQVFFNDFNYKFDYNNQIKKKILDSSILDDMITHKLSFNSCQILWRKECFLNNKFNELLMYAEEWECYSRILSEGAAGVSIDKVLYFGRKHKKSNTGEFQNKSDLRLESKARATKLIIDNLDKKGILSQLLIHHFIRLSFQIKNYDLLTFILKKSSYGILKKELYKFVFILYPFFRPIFVLKGKYIKPFCLLF